MFIWFLLMFVGLGAYLWANKYHDPQVQRNWRIVGIIFYLGSGLASQAAILLLLTTVCACAWIFQTYALWQKDKK